MGLFSNLFGGGRKPEKYKGIRPFASLQEIPQGKLLTDELEARMRGERVGFRPEILSQSTAPFALSRRTALKEKTIPTISAAASARGLGRSTITTGQIGQASSQAERDIMERIAQINLANEQQRRAEINEAVLGTERYVGAEAQQRTVRANFDYNDFLNQEQAQTAYSQRQAQGLGRALSLGTSMAMAPFTGGASLMAVPSTFGDNAGGTSYLPQIMAEMNRRGGATVNTGDWRYYSGGARGRTTPLPLSSYY